MILEIAEIKRLSQQKLEENKQFISFAKTQDPERLDRLVHDLDKQISSVVDCTLCGNCCTKLRPVLSENDIDKLLKVKRMSRMEFKEQYIETDLEGDMLLKHLPCIFYKDRQCTIYSLRPEECASYPNLHKPEITERIAGIMDSYAICPIVFNVIEELKGRLGFAR